MIQNIDINKIVTIAEDAGAKIMDIYEHEDFWVEFKWDDSPLTKADTAANTIIISRLKELYPEIPILSEEEKKVSYSQRKDWEYFWCVDPLDGTKEFIKRNGDFTVNIALIHKDTPVLWVIFAPVHKTSFYSISRKGAYKKSEKDLMQLLHKEDQKRPESSLRIVASRSHRWEDLDGYLENLQRETGKNIDFISVGSSLKFTIIADGRADMYPRFVPTMEWDTAAGQAILEELGYSIRVYETGELLRYNRENLRNPFFIAE